MAYESFFNYLEKKLPLLVRTINESNKIFCVSHLDADGLCSGGILIKLLKKSNKLFNMTIIKNIEPDFIENLKNKDYYLFIFTDIGSGSTHLLSELVSSKKVIIIDHHPISENLSSSNLIHINPHEINIDGGSEISASVLTYFIAKALKVEGISHLALTGAIGDNQEKGEFKGLNKIMLEENTNTIEVKKGLKIFGRISKPIHKALAQSDDPIIPGVSGDESATVQFLSEIGINIKDGEKFRTLNDLNEEEQKHLIASIIMKRNTENFNPDDIFGKIYIIKNKQDVLSDAREFSTLLNSCGRQGFQGLGLALTLNGNEANIEEAKSLMNEYRKKLIEAMNWLESVKENPDYFIQEDNILYIIANKNISDTMIGTLCSMIAQSKKNDNLSMIIGFADSDNGTKVSGRLLKEEPFEVGDLISKAALEVMGQGGGHAKAGGAKIPLGKEKEFISVLNRIIKDINLKKFDLK